MLCRCYLDAISRLNNLISSPQRREKQIAKQVLIPTVTEFATCSWPLSSVLWMSQKFCFQTLQTVQFSFQLASVTYSQKFHTDIQNAYWIWTRALIGQLHSMLSDLTLTLIFPWEKMRKPEKPHIIKKLEEEWQL